MVIMIRAETEPKSKWVVPAAAVRKVAEAGVQPLRRKKRETGMQINNYLSFGGLADCVPVGFCVSLRAAIASVALRLHIDIDGCVGFGGLADRVLVGLCVAAFVSLSLM